MSARFCLLALAVVACGPTLRTEEDAAEEENPDAEEGSPEPPEECEPGCPGPLSVGQCEEDGCTRLSEKCFANSPDESRTCAERCEGEGAQCSPRGCNGATAVGWPLEPILCLDGEPETAAWVEADCDEPIRSADGSPVELIRCCCLYETP